MLNSLALHALKRSTGPKNPSSTILWIVKSGVTFYITDIIHHSVPPVIIPIVLDLVKVREYNYSTA